MTHIRIWWIGLVIVATAACATSDESVATGEQEVQRESISSTSASEHRRSKETLVIAVRHAERSTDHPVDPSLSAAGQLRAQALARVLEHTGITQIYSTQYRRTQQTAAPLAAATGTVVTLRPIDASNIATYAMDLADEIRSQDRSEAVLVVGHSNTIPELVNALSGITVPPIAEPEYSRIYMITLGREVRVVSARY
jgi:broad specificity phosphatase PhoE